MNRPIRNLNPQGWIRLAALVCPTAVLCVLLGPFLGVRATHGAAVGQSTSIPGWVQTQKDLLSHGYQGFAQRSSEIQAIMLRMNADDTTYHSLTALFVDHTPGNVPSSIRLAIQQPDKVSMSAYRSDRAEGIPFELMQAQSGVATVSSPAAGVRTTLSEVAARPPDIASVPVGVVPVVASGTKIQGIASEDVAWLADMFVHPATLLYLGFFQDKKITLAGIDRSLGRPAWLLVGTLAASQPNNPALGDSFRAWVDQHTGIILRLEYYSAGRIIGWGALSEVTIDGNGISSMNAQMNGRTPLGRLVSNGEYLKLTRTGSQ